MKEFSKADLHVHTRHSDRAAEWVLRRLEFPASCSEPREVYAALRKAGMDFVALTDTNTIDGCLEIAGLPGVIVGEEISAHFPEDGCRAHILAWGIDEAQHREIQKLRENIYDLQGYLSASGIAHAVAHPLHSPDEKLGPLHFQKLVLLFRHFEVLNARYSTLLGSSARFVLERLTPATIERLSAATGIVPTHPEPWKKVFVGGSDDHGGVHLAQAYTRADPAGTSGEFLAHIRDGKCEPVGEGGTPLAFAHSTYSVAFRHAKAKFAQRKDDATFGLIEKSVSRFLEGKDPTTFSLADKVGFVAQGIISGKIFELAKAGNSGIWKELSAYFSEPGRKEAIGREIEGVDEPERRAFLMANLIANQLGYRFFKQFIAQLAAGKFIESIQTISPLVPMLGLLSPYFYGFRSPPRQNLRDICLQTCGEMPPGLKNTKRAWFTDTLEDVNGVATTIRRMTEAGVAEGKDITVVTCRSQVADHGIPLKNFQPIGEFELPEYELQSLSFPPVLHILDWIAREGFTELIISTPGPVGLVAILAAKALGLRCVGIYHTDFPQYVRILTDDSFMETLTWNYMHWFYNQLDLIYLNSEEYRRIWAKRGIPSDRLRILPRGLDTELFQPSRREPAFWPSRGLREDEIAVLYVGRISKEKNLDVLLAATRYLAEWKVPARPIFVGDGPYRAELQRLLPDAIFTGYLIGEDLAKAYASADLFAFPSTTDTFGNVIVEAQASGIPVIVSDVGGPMDLVEDGSDGFITRSLDGALLAEAIRTLCENRALRLSMGGAGRRKVEGRDWRRAFDAFWAVSPE